MQRRQEARAVPGVTQLMFETLQSHGLGLVGQQRRQGILIARPRCQAVRRCQLFAGQCGQSRSPRDLLECSPACFAGVAPGPRVGAQQHRIGGAPGVPPRQAQGDDAAQRMPQPDGRHTDAGGQSVDLVVNRSGLAEKQGCRVQSSQHLGQAAAVQQGAGQGHQRRGVHTVLGGGSRLRRASRPPASRVRSACDAATWMAAPNTGVLLASPATTSKAWASCVPWLKNCRQQPAGIESVSHAPSSVRKAVAAFGLKATASGPSAWTSTAVSAIWNIALRCPAGTFTHSTEKPCGSETAGRYSRCWLRPQPMTGANCQAWLGSAVSSVAARKSRWPCRTQRCVSSAADQWRKAATSIAGISGNRVSAAGGAVPAGTSMSWLSRPSYIPVSRARRSTSGLQMMPPVSSPPSTVIRKPRSVRRYSTP